MTRHTIIAAAMAVMATEKASAQGKARYGTWAKRAAMALIIPTLSFATPAKAQLGNDDLTQLRPTQSRRALAQQTIEQHVNLDDAGAATVWAYVQGQRYERTPRRLLARFEWQPTNLDRTFFFRESQLPDTAARGATLTGRFVSGGHIFGSGFLVSPCGHVVTDEHVAEGMDKYAPTSVSFLLSESEPLRLSQALPLYRGNKHSDTKPDLAVFRFPQLRTDYLQIEAHGTPSGPHFVVGYPRLFQGARVATYATLAGPDEHSPYLEQWHGLAFPGVSGGPLVSGSTGKVSSVPSKAIPDQGIVRGTSGAVLVQTLRQLGIVDDEGNVQPGLCGGDTPDHQLSGS